MMRSNLADYIEAFILGKLAVGREDIVVLKRNEVAEAMECAPSQVTYVLSTRFTVDRGFQVESRRGAGGFVRIARMPEKSSLCEDVIANLNPATTLQDFERMLIVLQRRNVLTQREARLINDLFRLLQGELEPDRRMLIMQSLLLSLTEQE